jgi:hypothetical protein
MVGLVCYVTFWISALLQAFQAVRGASGFYRAVSVGTLGAIVHLTVHSFFDSLYVHTMYLHMAVLLGLLVVVQRQLRDQVREADDDACGDAR